MLSKIENIICLGEGVTPGEIHSKSRKAELRETRQIIMYFAKELNPGWTLTNIAGYFGLDHATATHAQKTVINLVATNKQFREKIQKHRMRLKAIKIDKMVIHASDSVKPLAYELAKLELKITDLRLLINSIKADMVDINTFTPEPFAEPVKEQVLEPIKEVIGEPIKFRYTKYNSPFANLMAQDGAYSGYKHY